MLLLSETVFTQTEFENEEDFEKTVIGIADHLIGTNRVYVDVKRRIGQAGSTQNIPDGYLLDLSSNRDPKLYVVENELSRHDHMRHIAVQILQFSLSFETSTYSVKSIIKEALDSEGLMRCQMYMNANNIENLDVLLERMIYGEDSFNALVIIDELSDDLEKVLISRFRFPVEVLTLQRFKDISGSYLYKFDPFLQEIDPEPDEPNPIDPSEIDTIVVPARDEGFNETFLGENRWYQIRISSSMIPKLKYIAVYRVGPTSAITHIPCIKSVEQWRDTNKYVVNFTEAATEIAPSIKLGQRSHAPQSSRYTSKARIDSASSMDDVF